MPSEKLVPYKLSLHESYSPENTYDLTNLTSHDPHLPNGYILDIIEDFLEESEGENLRDVQEEKTFVVETYAREGNLIEGYISTGDYGYEADLRHVETGELTHRKDEMEAEQLPFYFLMYLPETTDGETYAKGQRLFILLEQINRAGIKGALNDRLKRFLIGRNDQTVMKMEPVYTRRIYDKIIESDRIYKIEFEVHKLPGDDDEKSMSLVKGMEVEDSEKRTLVFQPSQGGSLEKFRERIERAKDNEKQFAELVAKEVEDVRAKVVNSGGRSETVPLMKNEVAMRRDLTGNGLNYEHGLLTPDTLRREAAALLSDILDPEYVKEIETGASVQR